MAIEPRVEHTSTVSSSVKSRNTIESLQLLQLLQLLEFLEDQDFGVSLAVPAGWITVFAAQPEGTNIDNWLDELEPGYAVGFESPRQHWSLERSHQILPESRPRASPVFANKTLANSVQAGRLQLGVPDEIQFVFRSFPLSATASLAKIGGLVKESGVSSIIRGRV